MVASDRSFALTYWPAASLQ